MTDDAAVANAEAPKPLRALRSDVLTMLAARAVVGLVNVGIVALVAHSLGPAGQGRVAVALTTLLVAVQLGNFGLSSATTVWSSQASNVPKVITAALWWSLGIGLPIGACVAAAAIATNALSLTDGDAVVIAVAAPFVLASSLLHGVLLGQGKARAMNATEAGSAVAALVSVAVALHLFDAGPTGALAAGVSQFGLAVPIFLWLLRRNLPRRVSVDRALALDLLRFSRWPFAAAVFGFLVVRVDVLVVDAVLGAGDAGRYAVAVTLSQAVYLFPLAIGINLMPRAARGRSVEDTANVMRRLALPYAGLCLLLGLLADPIVDIGFGAEYRESVELLRLLLPGTFALGALAIVSYHFAATGYPRQAVLAWAVGLVFDVAVNVALLDELGVETAAIASSATYIGLAAVNGRLFWRSRTQRP